MDFPNWVKVFFIPGNSQRLHCQLMTDFDSNHDHFINSNCLEFLQHAFDHLYLNPKYTTPLLV